MKAKTKVLLTSAMAITMSASLITGASLALFTDEAPVNIAITAGNVDVEATLVKSSLVTKSFDVVQNEGEFENGGTATFNADFSELALTYVTPGDAAEVTIDVVNNSNVDVKYRVRIVVDGELAEALTATAVIDGKEYDITATGSPWKSVEANAEIGDITVAVEFPDAEDNNNYKNATANISYIIEAIQNNAPAIYETLEDGTVVATAFTAAGVREALGKADIVKIDGEVNALDNVYVLDDVNEGAEIIVPANKVLSDGKIVMDNTAKWGVYVDATSGETILSNLEVESDSRWSVALAAADGAAITLNNVSVNATQGAGIYSFYEGDIVLNDVKVNHEAISDANAAVTPWAATALAASNGANVTVNGGEYYGATYGVYVYNSGATVTINDGTFKAKEVLKADGSYSDKNVAGKIIVNGGNFDGAVVMNNGYASVEIKGGTFTNFSVQTYSPLVITGGTFDADPSAYIPDYCKAVKSNGVWTVIKGVEVTTAEELIENAVGGTMVAIPAGAEIVIDEDVVIENPVAGAPSIINNGTLTISNGKYDNGLTISGSHVIENRGELTIYGGKFGTDETSAQAIRNIGGNVTINGGEFASYNRTLYPNIWAYVFYSENGTITINDGVVNCTPNGIFSTGTNGKIVVNGGEFAKLRDNNNYYLVYASSGIVELNGGYFEFHSSDNCIWPFSGAVENCVINGGTYNFDESTVISNFTDRVADGYKAVQMSNGNYVVVDEDYEVVEGNTASSAIAAGGDVVLGADAKLSSAISNDLSLDLNGNTLTVSGSNAYSGSNLSLSNGTHYSNTSSGYLDIRPAASTGNKVVVDGVTFTSEYKNVSYGNSTNRVTSAMEYCAPAAGVECEFVFTNCVFNNTQVIFEGMSGKTGIFTATFENCVFNTFGNSSGAPIYVQNFVNGTINVKNTTFNVTATSSMAAISISPNSSTNIDLNLENVTLNVTLAEAYTHDASKGETAADDVKINNPSAKLYSVGANTTVNNVGAAIKTEASTQTALNNAISENKEATVTLTQAGTYTLTSDRTAEKVITINGTTDTVIDLTKGNYFDGSTMSFNGVTIKGSTGYAGGASGGDYAALYSENVTYTDCVFDGPFKIGRDGAKFINCTFTNLGNDYVWTYGNDVTFIGCTFETEGKALLIYKDGGSEISKVTVKDCTFKATQGRKAGAIANQNCAAIEIDNRGCGVNLVLEGNKYNTEYFSGEWRIKQVNSSNTMIVNGVEYSQIALDGKLMSIDSSNNVTVIG